MEIKWSGTDYGSLYPDLDSRGLPTRYHDVEEMANQLLADHDPSTVGKRWVINCFKRQPELKTCFHRRYDYEKVQI